jgi:hypothetical protein
MFIFNPRYRHDDILFPRRRNRDRILVARKLGIRANDDARHTRARGKNRACAESGR